MKLVVFICAILAATVAEETKKDKRGLLGLGDLSYGHGVALGSLGSGLALDHGLELSGPILSGPVIKGYGASIGLKSAPILAPAPLYTKSFVAAPAPIITKSYSAPLLTSAPLLSSTQLLTKSPLLEAAPWWSRTISAPLALKSGPIIASAPLSIGYGGYGGYGHGLGLGSLSLHH